MRLTKATRITTVKAAFSRGEIAGDVNASFAEINLPGMQFKGEDGEQGYFYSNWTHADLKELSDAILAFLDECNEATMPATREAEGESNATDP